MRLDNKRKAPNQVLDFVLGLLGVIGLVIELVRNRDNEVHWGAFIAGFAVSFGAGTLLMAMYVAFFVAITSP